VPGGALEPQLSILQAVDTHRNPDGKGLAILSTRLGPLSGHALDHAPIVSDMKASRTTIPLFFGLGLLVVVLAFSQTKAWAGDTCEASRAANALLGCDHCQSMKKLLGDDAVSRMSLELHDFDRGVLVEVHAGDTADRAYVAEFVEEMWVRSDYGSRRLSTRCENRYRQLDLVRVEKAPTEDGVFLILSSDDTSVVEWLQDDAKSTKDYVLAASTN
jgi:hypothetical protein